MDELKKNLVGKTFFFGLFILGDYLNGESWGEPLGKFGIPAFFVLIYFGGFIGSRFKK